MEMSNKKKIFTKFSRVPTHTKSVCEVIKVEE